MMTISSRFPCLLAARRIKERARVSNRKDQGQEFERNFYANKLRFPYHRGITDQGTDQNKAEQILVKMMMGKANRAEAYSNNRVVRTQKI